jgi:hypothetical protein
MPKADGYLSQISPAQFTLAAPASHKTALFYAYHWSLPLHTQCPKMMDIQARSHLLSLRLVRLHLTKQALFYAYHWSLPLHTQCPKSMDFQARSHLLSLRLVRLHLIK